ncbi:hypothetical protein AB0P36_34400 [Streptomyces flavidovirens]|uniref:hypothetical protein n=1 Tax=Streptomyces flavidovirens TaxID=67298 RepID=UPI0034267A77
MNHRASPAERPLERTSQKLGHPALVKVPAQKQPHHRVVVHSDSNDRAGHRSHPYGTQAAHRHQAEVVPAWPDVPAGLAREAPVKTFTTGETVVRRDVHRSGRVWSEQALRVIADTSEALVTACTPGAQARWPALYAKARAEGDRTVRTEACDAMAAGEWELAPGVWQETELLLWKPPGAWFSPPTTMRLPPGSENRSRVGLFAMGMDCGPCRAPARH